MPAPDRAVAVETTISAPYATVWNALRDPAEIRRWHGWDYDEDGGLDGEIEIIYVDDVEIDEAAGTIGIADGSRFEVEARGPNETVVRVTMPAPAGGASWDEFYDDLREGWTTFVEQLRFALEAHPGEERRTLKLDGAPALAPDTGREAFRTGHQVGYVVDAYGPGLVVLHAKPDGGGMAIVTAYGLDDHAFAALQERWRAAYAA